jgi:long-subunit acyl-CoA synthetase (AMP-forming)
MITTDSIATQTLADTFLSTVQERADGPALLHPDLSVALSWREYGEQARRAAGGLAELGLRRGDTLGLLLTNRPEFHIADVAALLLGATPFSMYNTSAPRGVDAANAKLARVEQIKRFAILDGDWLPDSDELTPTMKLKRRPIAEKYAAQIAALYTTGETR